MIELRQNALNTLLNNEDKFFLFYDGTGPNLIPLINQDSSREVFILTGSNDGSQLLLGNDYKLTYDSDNQLINKKRLHNTLITINTEGETMDSGKTVGSVHTHVIDDLPFMTSTDICTYLLYKDVLELSNHVVVSKDYMSIFDANEGTFIIVPKNMFKK